MSASKKSISVDGENLTYWRSIENRRRTKEYLSSIENEFAKDFTEISSMDRRSMLKVMGATIALSGIGVSCRRPEEKILPYVKSPEDAVLGLPNFYATAQPTPFGANGLVVESHEGRPTKIEGNPSHPESLGKASVINQASVLEVYDPDRSRYCVKNEAGQSMPKDWAEWDSFAEEHFLSIKKANGDGLSILTNTDLSPSFLRLKDAIKASMPLAKFYVHEPMRQQNVESASEMCFGKGSRVRYHFDQAQIIATLFCDPFSFGPEHLRNQRGFSKNREVHSVPAAKTMNRLYAIEADYSLGGTNADHRLRLSVGQAPTLVRALAYELHATFSLDLDLNIPGAKSLSSLVQKPPSLNGIDRRFIIAMAKDLAMHRGKALIVGGDHLPKEVLALIHILNLTLRGYGKTFEVVKLDNQREIDHLAEPGIKELTDELTKKHVKTLLILSGNPVYDAPRHLKFDQALKNAGVSIHLGQSRDETGFQCTWHLPQTHFLEHFGDARAYDGHITIIQPLIKPLHNARSTLQLLAQIAGFDETNPLSLVKDTFKTYRSGHDIDKQFNRAIHDGVVANSSYAALTMPMIKSAEVYAAFDNVKARAPNKDNFELIVNFDRRVLDGRYANHGWLQELPDPVTKLNWGNALLMSPTAAREQGIKSGVKKNAYVADTVNVVVNSRSLELPVFVVPGLADHSVVTWLGYGRTRAGEVGNNVGIDVYDLVGDLGFVQHGIKIERTGKTLKLSSTQEQFAMNGDTVQEIDTLSLQSRDPARVTKVSDFVKNPSSAQNIGLTKNLLVNEPGKKNKVPLQITEPWDYSKGNQWGMVIDLAKCTGCNACVVACQSENNIPVVGKERVIEGRIMHWLRVDRYFVGDVKSPQAISQPVTCQHCENAPCEPVCPVAATSHDKEGLNVMTYNRCVGTRYCGNNCPFKVRRFNYFDFSHSGNIHVDKKIAQRQKTIKLQRNPDVTVRYRGVMEKCTYCTQRIQAAKMDARRNGKDHNNLEDGKVVPACAQTCPSDAIVFGNINDESSRVSKLKAADRNYTMLDVLNVRPRTSYLSMLRNPNPDLVA